jgi:S-adenosyl-L-methionine methyltransferase
LSRLDSFIRRLQAQRACLNLAARLVRRLEGDVLELGLGNGRTYDHLRGLFPDRKIYVCERSVAAHPACIPPVEFLILGDMRDTLHGARGQLGGRIVLAHLDPGTGDLLTSQTLATELTPLITPLLCPGGVLVSEPALTSEALTPLGLPKGVAAGRYNLYRCVSRRASPSPERGRKLSPSRGFLDKPAFQRVRSQGKA